MRIERLGKMKIRQDGGGGRDGGQGRREGKQIEIRVRKVGDEQREIDVREGLEMIT